MFGSNRESGRSEEGGRGSGIEKGINYQREREIERSRKRELDFRGSEFTASWSLLRLTTGKDAHACAPRPLPPPTGRASKPAEFLAVTNYS